MDAALLSRLDVLQLAISFGGNRVTIRRMLKFYLETATKQLDILEQAGNAQNVLGWQKATRDLKSASHTITARRMASLCGEAEAIVMMPHPNTQSTLYHMQKELSLLRREIEGLLADN